MRVCHITSVHPARDVRIFYKECRSLAQRHEVTLIAPNVEDAVEEGVQLRGVPLPQSRLKRQFCLGRVYMKALKEDAQLYHLHDPELISLGLRLKRQGKRVVFDSHEDVPMQLLSKEYLPQWARVPLSRLYALHEQLTLAHYDALVTVTPSIADRLQHINPRTVMVTNYPTYRELSHTPQGDTPYVCFAGGVDEKYMHHVILQALPLTPARYLLAGRTFFPSYLQRLHGMEGWSQVDYQGVLPPQDVDRLYGRADIGLVLLDYLPNAGYHKGTLGVLKLFEYMMAGLPVVATDFDLWRQIVEDNHCGLCVDPHDVKAIADAINYLIDHPDEARRMGRNGQKAVKEQYNWATQEQVLFDLYEQLSREK